MEAQVTHPVQVLREHTVALEAALTVCLADPATKPVHRLRTETRRVEAQLLLLTQMPALPEHRKETERLRHALKRLRQAAGEVRDLDVQRKRLEEMADGEAEGADELTATAEGGEDGRSTAKAVRDGAAALRDYLKSKRENAAKGLQDLLEKHGSKAARAAEKLLAVLEPAEETPLAEDELLRQAEAVFAHSGLLAEGVPGDLDEDELHTVRKAAKAARYLAETLPGADGKEGGKSAGAVAASRFEALQEAGGQWHDALELAKAAKSFLGRRHELTEAIAAERGRHLESYRKALAGEAMAGEATAGQAAPGLKAKRDGPARPVK
ncbi:MAG: CHAD domain-containing protein, partial [Janthinobacterium lividum]